MVRSQHESRLVFEVLPPTKLLDAVRQYYGLSQDAARTNQANAPMSPSDLRTVRRSLLLDVAGTVLQKMSVAPFRSAVVQADVVQVGPLFAQIQNQGFSLGFCRLDTGH